MFNWLRKFFAPNKEDLEMIDAINHLFKEYDVYISPRGGLRKTSKPEFIAKHRKELSEMSKRIKI